jgi:hypothetical protein
MGSIVVSPAKQQKNAPLIEGAFSIKTITDYNFSYS